MVLRLLVPLWGLFRSFTDIGLEAPSSVVFALAWFLCLESDREGAHGVPALPDFDLDL
jgi:hypothetical protein